MPEAFFNAVQLKGASIRKGRSKSLLKAVI
jgi:hypothetical protein